MEFKSGEPAYFPTGPLRAFAVLRWAPYAGTRHFLSSLDHEPCLRRADGRPGALGHTLGEAAPRSLQPSFLPS